MNQTKQEVIDSCKENKKYILLADSCMYGFYIYKVSDNKSDFDINKYIGYKTTCEIIDNPNYILPI